MKNRTLVAWIGATDLASMGKDVGGQVKLQVEKAILLFLPSSAFFNHRQHSSYFARIKR